MLHSSIRLLAFVTILAWSSTAAAVPVLQVSASTNPIVGGIVQLQPGDQNVSITLEIVPDEDGVKQFIANFATQTSSILVDSCAAGAAGTTANCLTGGLGNTNWNFEAQDFTPAMLDPFTAGTVVLSLDSPIIGSVILVRGDIPSDIFDSNFVATSIRFQEIAVVVPEPGTALSMVAALATLGVVGRWRRNGSEGTA
jgi:hypothetical protein